jgi:hypothetical protein
MTHRTMSRVALLLVLPSGSLMTSTCRRSIPPAAETATRAAVFTLPVNSAEDYQALAVNATPATRQWRTIPVSNALSPSGGTCGTSASRLRGCLDNLNADDGSYVVDGTTGSRSLACTAAAAFANPTILEFSVPDWDDVADATLTADVFSTGDGAVSVECVEATGSVLATIMADQVFHTETMPLTWQLPPGCLTETTRVRFRTTGDLCLAADSVSVNVQTRRRRVPVDWAGPSNCADPNGCLRQLNGDDGNYLKSIACGTGATSTDFASPTHLRFAVPDALWLSGITEHTLEIDAEASGPTTLELSCLTAGASRTLSGVTFGAAGRRRARISVPAQCFHQAAVEIVATRPAGNPCLAVDHVALSIATPRSRVAPVAQVEAGSQCVGDEGQQKVMWDLANQNDSFLKWIACTARCDWDEGRKTELGDPTTLVFFTPDRPSAASFAIRGMIETTSAENNRLALSCRVAGTDDTWAEVGSATFLSEARTLSWALPDSCLGGEWTRVRVSRGASWYCLQADAVHLYTASNLDARTVFNPVTLLDAYVDQSSYDPGEPVNLMVSGVEAFDGELRRLTGPDTYEVVQDVAVARSAVPQHFRHDSYKTGARWARTLSFPAPPRSGYYLVALRYRRAEAPGGNGFQSFVPFVVGHDGPGRGGARVAVISSSNTAHAYNPWGGASLYQYSIVDGSGRRHSATGVSQVASDGHPFRPQPGGSSTIVATDRPVRNSFADPPSSHLFRGELAIVGWLERRLPAPGRAGAPPYVAIADEDFVREPGILGSFRSVIASTHAEYWTPQMRDALDAYLASGGRLMYLSGNGLYWKTVVSGNQLEVCKDRTHHTLSSAQSGAGGLWRRLVRADGSSAAEGRVLGVQFNPESYHAGTNQSPTTQLVLRSKALDHWLVSSLGLEPVGDVYPLGQGILGYEVDTLYGPGGPVTMELSTQDSVHLARGTQSAAGSPDAHTDVLYFRRADGGEVFSGSTISFGSALYRSLTPGGNDGAGKAQRNLSRVFTRVFNHLSRPGVADYDGDGYTDLVVWRPSHLSFYLFSSKRGVSLPGVHFGEPGVVPVHGDFDADGKADLAYWRPSDGFWFVLPSSTGVSSSTQWGAAGDFPLPADYDGDGQTDYVVFRPQHGRYYQRLSGTLTGDSPSVRWGELGDTPVIGDFDGDRRADYAVYRGRDRDWWVLESGGANYRKHLGEPGDIPVPGDYDRDGKTDLAVFTPARGAWTVLGSASADGATVSYFLGRAGDIPVPADYDGDGWTDPAVWRPSDGKWLRLFIHRGGAATEQQWGANGDVPLPRSMH